MYSRRPEHGDRRWRHRDQRDDGWEERREPHKGFLQDSCHRYGADRRSDSPQRPYSRDRDRRSPLRRPVSSPVWDASETNMSRCPDDEKSHHRYQSEPQRTTYRQPADRLGRDFKKAPPQKIDFKYRETHQDSRHRYRLQEFENQPRHDGVTYRRPSPSHRERARSQERPRSQERYSKISVKSRTASDSSAAPSYQQDRHPAGQLWQNGSSEQPHEGGVTARQANAPVKEQTTGFQRFLDVLNKGVNMETLKKIVTQSTTDAAPQPSCDQPSGAVDQPRTPRHISPANSRTPPGRRSLSPTRGLQSEEEAAAPAKTALTVEDEKKCRQMRDVLQAIGLDLGFEELGQMSHRIQERLYGRKDGDPVHRVGGESGSRPPPSPRRRSGSSSSRSSFTPLPREYSAQTDAPELEPTPQAQYRRHSQSQDGQYHQDSGSQDRQYLRDSGSQEGEYNQDSGSQGGQYRLDSGSQQVQYHRDSGSQEGQYRQYSTTQEGQYRLDPGTQQGQFQLDPGTQQGQYQLDPGSQGGQFQLDPGSQGGQFRLDPGSQGGQFQLDPGSQGGQFRLDPGSQGGQFQLDPGTQQGQFQLDPGTQQGQFQLDPGTQGGQYRLASGSQVVETCESAFAVSCAPSVPPPAPVMPPFPPAMCPPLLHPPLLSPPPPMMPHVIPGMLPQRLPFPPLPAALGLSSPSLPSAPSLNAAQRAKAVPRQRCLQVIQTKPG
ncbi:uncharacterized protein LOC115390307 isoform X2 [Salarias fasciatus]|uniref:uncharacterized protein LOC115390307 isoform X2 n=1 Tax=Salarias fasciatus TaxID=181472 RepID=UPI0011770D4E|nr:uncharacterized protein LOC115390307 isoform X2 [Salarias fasciatus]